MRRAPKNTFTDTRWHDATPYLCSAFPLAATHHYLLQHLQARAYAAAANPSLPVAATRITRTRRSCATATRTLPPYTPTCPFTTAYWRKGKEGRKEWEEEGRNRPCLCVRKFLSPPPHISIHVLLSHTRLYSFCLSTLCPLLPPCSPLTINITSCCWFISL